MNLDSGLDLILSADGVRQSCLNLYQFLKLGEGHFEVHEDRIEEAAEIVLEVIRNQYPHLKIPYHSRWGHFRVGQKHRVLPLEHEKKTEAQCLELARQKFDLVIPSVLLDAGAGADWKYQEEGKFYSRSEGLAVASFHMFCNGLFSTDSQMQTQGKKLLQLKCEDLKKGFQVAPNNPLLGLEGRLQLMKNLGEVLTSDKTHFPQGRLGDLVDYISTHWGTNLPAAELLKLVVHTLGPIWPGRLEKEGVNLGDCWIHSKLNQKGEGLIAFHKLSQWLTYSLVEPLEEAGFEINDLNKLTGLAEYRNGGLFIDSGVLTLKDPETLKTAHLPSSDLIIEWRAATVILLDQVATMVRDKLHLSEKDFPLAKVLEGGTWWAGRRLAAQKRPDGSPPLQIQSDGTVF